MRGRSRISHDSPSSISYYYCCLHLRCRCSSSCLALLCCLLLELHLMGSEAGLGVFDHGAHAVTLTRVDEASRCGGAAPSPPAADDDGLLPPPPKPLLVAAPREAGEYPVLLFLHGFMALNSFYSQLFHHVASHGFIVVGPQLYTFSGPDTTEEISSAAAVISWLGRGLRSSLPPGVRADLTKLSVSGHSRGGKVAFALALGHHGNKAKTNLALPLAAVVAVDPVDGTGMGAQTPPPILTGRRRSLPVGAPAMVLGTGLGELPRCPLLPPCAPRSTTSWRRVGGGVPLPPRGRGLRAHGHDGRRHARGPGPAHARRLQERRRPGAHAQVRGRRHRRVPEQVGARGRRRAGRHQGVSGAGARRAVRRGVSR